MDDITMEYETVARFHLPTQNLVLRAPSCVNVSLSLSVCVCVCVCVCVWQRRQPSALIPTPGRIYATQ